MYLLLESPYGLNCFNVMSVTDQGTLQLSFEAGQAAPIPAFQWGDRWIFCHSAAVLDYRKVGHKPLQRHHSKATEPQRLRGNAAITRMGFSMHFHAAAAFFSQLKSTNVQQLLAAAVAPLA